MENGLSRGKRVAYVSERNVKQKPILVGKEQRVGKWKRGERSKCTKNGAPSRGVRKGGGPGNCIFVKAARPLEKAN